MADDINDSMMSDKQAEIRRYLRRVLDAAGHIYSELLSEMPIKHYSWRLQVTGIDAKFDADLARTICINGVRLADCSYFYAKLEGVHYQVLIIFGYITDPYT